MKHILTLAALVFATSCFGQIPDHVATDGLVAWWPLEVDGQDVSGNCNHLMEHNGVQFIGGQGAFGGIYLDGVDDYLSCVPFNGVDGSSDHSLAFWTSGEIEIGKRWIFTEYNAVAQPNKSLHCGIRTAFCSESTSGIAAAVSDFYGNQAVSLCFSDTSWTHWVMTYESGSGERKIFKNGELQYEANLPAYQSDLNDGVLVGGIKYGYYDSPQIGTAGYIDDVGVWSRPLMEGEVVALYESLALATPGCMEEAACNYTPEATFSDGSCDLISCHCLEGTAWDESLGGCIPLISAETACGEGTVWDIEAQNCVIATPSDTDFDGCVAMTDLLNLLSVFGTCDETPWSCGDPIEYQGYDYETVHIGEQCWFAENARFLPSVDLPNSTSFVEPKFYVTNYFGTDLEAALNQPSYLSNGALYNWPAVVSGDLCPTGWRVPNEWDWQQLELTLGMTPDEVSEVVPPASGISRGEEQLVGDALKAPSFGGSGSAGFNVLPSGYLRNGEFLNTTNWASYWTSTQHDGLNAFDRFFSGNASGVWRSIDLFNDAFSVRCIKDAE